MCYIFVLERGFVYNAIHRYVFQAKSVSHLSENCLEF